MGHLHVNGGLPEKEKEILKRNFQGPRLYVYEFKYEFLNQGTWEDRSVNICCDSYERALSLLIKSFGNVKFNIKSCNTQAVEIHVIAQDIKKELYRELQKEFDPEIRKIRG